MKTCPPFDALRRLLAGDLAGSEASALEDHLERCAACQALLDQFTKTQLPTYSAFLARSAGSPSGFLTTTDAAVSTAFECWSDA